MKSTALAVALFGIIPSIVAMPPPVSHVTVGVKTALPMVLASVVEPEPAQVPLPALALSPSPSPVLPLGVIEVLQISLEILNYHYDDLEREALIQLGATAETESAIDVGMNTEGSLFGDTVSETIGNVFEKLILEGLQNSSGALPPPSSMAGLSPLGLTMLNVASAPAAAPVAAPMASPASAPGADLSAPVNIFVTFRPGQRRKLAKESKESFLQASTVARSTIVDVMITEKPMSGAQYLHIVQSIVEQAISNGVCRRHLLAALLQATGLRPIIKFHSKSTITRQHIKEWDEETCETHLTKVVRMFEVAYTRRMVPMALYNECTNYIPALTFSHDHIFSPLDRKKCRMATIKFAQRWDYGKAHWKYGMEKKPEPMDFAAFCHDICHMRFGEGHPQCNVP